MLEKYIVPTAHLVRMEENCTTRPWVSAAIFARECIHCNYYFIPFALAVARGTENAKGQCPHVRKANLHVAHFQWYCWVSKSYNQDKWSNFSHFYVVRIRTYLAEDNPGYACRIVPMACCLNSSARATHVINEVAFMMKMNALSISRKNRKR